MNCRMKSELASSKQIYRTGVPFQYLVITQEATADNQPAVHYKEATDVLNMSRNNESKLTSKYGPRNVNHFHERLANITYTSNIKSLCDKQQIGPLISLATLMQPPVGTGIPKNPTKPKEETVILPETSEPQPLEETAKKPSCLPPLTKPGPGHLIPGRNLPLPICPRRKKKKRSVGPSKYPSQPERRPC
ncbi:hypothetical protein O0L34_g13966 [Tuta absoluta]|nr:hypothetical protein O0L34_g13966 [Tuta absoluta]